MRAWLFPTPPLSPPFPSLSHVSDADVATALSTGTVVLSKSDLDARPCAKLVVDSGDGRVTAVVSACPADTGVVTVWDRTANWTCDCP